VGQNSACCTTVYKRMKRYIPSLSVQNYPYRSLTFITLKLQWGKLQENV